MNGSDIISTVANQTSDTVQKHFNKIESNQIDYSRIWSAIQLIADRVLLFFRFHFIVVIISFEMKATRTRTYYVSANKREAIAWLCCTVFTDQFFVTTFICVDSHLDYWPVFHFAIGLVWTTTAQFIIPVNWTWVVEGMVVVIWSSAPIERIVWFACDWTEGRILRLHFEIEASIRSAICRNPMKIVRKKIFQHYFAIEIVWSSECWNWCGFPDIACISISIDLMSNALLFDSLNHRFPEVYRNSQLADFHPGLVILYVPCNPFNFCAYHNDKSQIKLSFYSIS